MKKQTLLIIALVFVGFLLISPVAAASIVDQIPEAVQAQFWALVLAIIAAIIAYFEKSKKDEAKQETQDVIAYFDPTDKTVEQPPAIVPARTYLMSAETRAFILSGESPEDQVSITQQIADAEAKKLATYQITYSKGYYKIEYGLISSSGRGK